MCTFAIISDIGIDECQSNHSKSEQSRGRHLPNEIEETYLLDARLLAENDWGALDLVCNMAEGEPAALLRGAETVCPINGCVCKNGARHYLVVCQTATSSSQQQPGQLEKEKAATEKNSVDGFVGNTFPAVCGFHRSTST
ncbi:hypothetical protein BgiBS90_035736 [Biomphalaria glabrata]|nr:hypothetical protein BgiBS90_035736 [Biomphalaria glabrata]